MLKSDGIRAWIFDFGGTLDADGVPWLDRFHAIYLQAGVKIEKTDLDAAFDRVEKDLLSSGRATSTTLQSLINDHVRLQMLHLNRADPLLASRLSESFFLDSSRALTRSSDLLSTIKSKGLKTGIISNFYGNLTEICRSSSLLDHLDVILDSAVEKCSKPSEEIFHRALSRLDLPPSEAVMVGDNYSRDILPAKQLGMKTVLITPRERIFPDLSAADLRLSSVTELRGRF